MSWSQLLRATSRLLHFRPSSSAPLLSKSPLCSSSYNDVTLEEEDKLGFTNMVLRFANKVTTAPLFEYLSC